MCARCGVGEDQRDIFGAHIAAIGPISGARSALNPAGDLQFFVCVTVAAFVAAFGHNRDLSKIARRA